MKVLLPDASGDKRGIGSGAARALVDIINRSNLSNQSKAQLGGAGNRHGYDGSKLRLSTSGEAALTAGAATHRLMPRALQFFHSVFLVARE